jgi:renalase
VTRLTLEIAVSTPEEAERAVANGADRLELSSGLEVGGLTPSLGLFRAVRERVAVPLWVLLRPRPGGFVYTDGECGVMRADAETFLDEGANGLVFGCLRPHGGADYERCRPLVEVAKGRAVFHRAFDSLPNPLTALDEVIDLGFARVLTSGFAPTAKDGADVLAYLVQQAGSRIEILPAGRIRPKNVAALIRVTGCNQVHAAARDYVPDEQLAQQPQLAASMGRATELSADLVCGLRLELDQLADSLS